jgi:hypothetical protein
MPAAVFSPDGRWVAYTSGASTNDDAIYAQPVPPTGARYQISQAGENGHDALWSRDGKELFYVPLVGRFVVRSVSTQPGFTFGNPVAVARTFPVAAPTTPRTFDITPDGKIVGVALAGSLAEVPGGGSAASVTAAGVLGRTDPTVAIRLATTRQICVVLNWFEELKARVRAP